MAEKHGLIKQKKKGKKKKKKKKSKKRFRNFDQGICFVHLWSLSLPCSRTCVHVHTHRTAVYVLGLIGMTTEGEEKLLTLGWEIRRNQKCVPPNKKNDRMKRMKRMKQRKTTISHNGKERKAKQSKPTRKGVKGPEMLSLKKKLEQNNSLLFMCKHFVCRGHLTDTPGTL